ncbi:2'-5' RNA ligase [Halorubrum aquaticum]|uniref:RNA 2',3'-cyclic phosphodiesterase n=1 Tax=Halorubrum aquaticum TaxID=387340 RepID=A0A1I3AV86_9EURY|nr:RNA 2',3'-cyclic phosphodiesterase [Halorubrum aquaticum]SFH53649.1 2'-5' RNA ligase [Halorubrum aquaticum]
MSSSPSSSSTSSSAASSSSSVRAFFAVELPDDLAEPIADLQSSLADAPGIRPTDPSQAHLTLKFLGDVAAADLDGVRAAGERAVDRAGVEPFDCTVKGLGVFPSLEYVSVVWAGIGRGSEELTDLHEALEAETTALGFEPEEHAFTPHVTLARMDDGREKDLVREVVRERDPELGRFEVEEVRLIESTLTESGPVYDPIETFALGSR